MLLSQSGNLLAVAGLVQVVSNANSSSGAENSCNSGLLLAGEPLALLGGTGAPGGALLANAPPHTFDAVVREDLVLIDEEDVVGHSCLRVLESLGALESGRSSLGGGFLDPFLENVLQGIEGGLLGGLPGLAAVALHPGLGELSVLLLQPDAVVDPPQLIIGHTVYFGLLGRTPLLGIHDAGLADTPLHAFNTEVHKF